MINEEAIEFIEIDISRLWNTPQNLKHKEALEMAIKALSEQRIGHWIQTNEFFINQDRQFIYKFICSECKSLSYFRKSNKKAIGANVCPNCGAKMESEEEAWNSKS